MRRPGFAQVHYDSATRTASVVKLTNVPNKKAPAGVVGGKPHGQILDEIYEATFAYMADMNIALAVKESSFARFSRETEAINKAHGIIEYVLWHYRDMSPQELAATHIKKVITNKGTATKEDVEAALEKFVGKIYYECDDESDAVAVAIAWLLDNGYIDNPYNQEDNA